MTPDPWKVVAACGLALALLYVLGICVQCVLARRWPSVQGEVAENRLVRRRGRAGSTDYAYVAYRYEVDGRPYRNDRMRFGPQVRPASIVPSFDPAPQTDAATRLAEEFPQGRPVRIYYNPRNPAASVLYRTPNVAVWGILVVVLVFGVRVARQLL